MTFTAIDPGPQLSAFIRYDRGTVREVLKWENDLILKRLKDLSWNGIQEHLVIEMMAGYGMPVGKEVFETCVWIGRFIQAYGGPHSFAYRKDIKIHLCGTTRAKDANVRQALIDRFGGKDAAIGKKANPGPLYAFKADLWSALAVAVYYSDKMA